MKLVLPQKTESKMKKVGFTWLKEKLNIQGFQLTHQIIYRNNG